MLPGGARFLQDLGRVQHTLIRGTELEVSRLGLGCWAIGGHGWGPDVDDDASRGAIEAALEAGITLFDTAPIYGDGHADRLLREVLGSRICEVTVATKAGPRGERPVCELSEENLRRDIEASLERLGVDRIDLLQVHWPDEIGTPLEHTMAALVALRDEGLLGEIGLCNYGPTALDRACELGPVRVLQTPLSWIRREYEGELSEVVARRELSVLAYEPLARGLLTGKYQRLPRFARGDVRREDRRFWAAGFARLQPHLRQHEARAKKLGVPPSALAIAWAASRPNVAAALFGAKTAAQVRDNVRAAELLSR